jgi:transcriptional repressor NrdR
VKCPYCGSLDNKVIDSRLSKEQTTIRRRRDCQECKRRFTTYERVEEIMPMVVKKDGSREIFDRNKIVSGIMKACQKRPVSAEAIEDFIQSLEQELQDWPQKEIPSEVIGEKVINKLREWDDVAYVRFASVYRQFKDIREFMDELTSLLNQRREKEYNGSSESEKG